MTIRLALLVLMMAGSLFTQTAQAAKDKDNNTTSVPWSTLDTEAEPLLPEHDFTNPPEPSKAWTAPEYSQIFFGGAITSGGDELESVEIQSGNSIKTETLYAGNRFYVYTGALVRIPSVNFRTHISLGYMFDLIQADNGSVFFTRYPLDIIPFWEHKKHQFGLGITMHFNSTVDASEAGGSVIDYDTTLGSLAYYKYRISKKFSAGMRYTEIEYKPKNAGISSSNGTHFGLHLEYTYN